MEPKVAEKSMTEAVSLPKSHSHKEIDKKEQEKLVQKKVNKMRAFFYLNVGLLVLECLIGYNVAINTFYAGHSGLLEKVLL